MSDVEPDTFTERSLDNLRKYTKGLLSIQSLAEFEVVVIVSIDNLTREYRLSML